VKPLQKRNYHILRFNSRGVGQSTGWSSFTGFNEATDLEAMVRWGLQAVPEVRSLAVIVSETFLSSNGLLNSSLQGYSHGSLIASLHPVLPAPIKTSHVLISYPLGPRGWLTLFHTSTYTSKLKELIHDSTANVLVLFGDRDEFTAGAKYEAWSKELEHEATGMGSLNVVKIANATHFWSGRERQKLGQVLEEWLP